MLRCKTRRHWLGQWRPDTATMSPLRAVVSRGHIAENLLTAGFLLGRPCKDLAFAASVFPATPQTAARKAPRLCSGRGYPIRWRCRRLHITRGHIAHQHLIVPVSHRICARLADCRPRNYPLGQSKTSCFSLRHKRRCSAAKPEDIGLAGGDPMPPTMSPLRAVVSRGHIAPPTGINGAFALCLSRLA